MSQIDPAFLSDPDLRESRLLRAVYDRMGRRANVRLIAGLARRLEGGDMRSKTLRRLLWRQYGVEAAAFSYGAFHEPGAAEPGLTIGRFASVSRDARWGLGHPMDHVALSHVFAQPQNGFTDRWPFERPTLEIGGDAWIGSHAVITSACRRIGVGAVVGAGSVVTKDVPDFAVVTGAPADIRRYRFSEPVREAILMSKWWERPLDELREVKQAFLAPVDDARTLAALAKLAPR